MIARKQNNGPVPVWCASFFFNGIAYLRILGKEIKSIFSNFGKIFGLLY